MMNFKYLLLLTAIFLAGCESFENFKNRTQQMLKMPCDKASAEKFLAQEYETNDFFAFYRKFKLNYKIVAAGAYETRNGYSYCTLRLDYSSNRDIARMITSIQDSTLALIEFDGGLALYYKEDALGKIYFDSDCHSSTSYFCDFSYDLARLDKALKKQNCELAYKFKLVGVDIKEVNRKYGYEDKCTTY